MKNAVLIIYDSGDPSVGIFPASWSIDCPYVYDERDEHKDFVEDIRKAYQEYASGYLTVEYEQPKTKTK